MGLNKPRQKSLGELDHIMQALEIVPEQENLGQVAYKKDVFDRLLNQSLPKNYRLLIEKLANLNAQPSELPQFHDDCSQTTSIYVDEDEKYFREGNINLGTKRSAIEQFRPEGRLVTTLYEHSQPVSTVAVSDDQMMILSGSQDG